MSITSYYLLTLSILYPTIYSQFPDITFDYTSTEDYNGVNHSIGWVQFLTCTEGSTVASIPTLGNGLTIAQLQNISQYAITTKFLTGNDIPGVTENTAYAVKSDICSNPIYALNNGYELSYTLDITNSFVTGLSNLNNWIGTTTAKNRLSNGCHTYAGIGTLPGTLLDTEVFGAYCNGAGLHLITGNSVARWPLGTRCQWDWENTVGQDISVWIGFDQNKIKWCKHQNGNYVLLPPTSAPTLTPSYSPSNNPSLTPTTSPTSPSNNPTLAPTTPTAAPTSPCDFIDGGGWKLVRHSYNGWHSATDNAIGTDVYGTSSEDLFDINKWSIEYNSLLSSSTEFMFSNGGCTEYLITCYSEILRSYAGVFNFYVIKSHYDENYSSLCYNRAGVPEDPWISFKDHTADGYKTILYGEANFGGALTRFTTYTDKAVNVWIRNSTTEIISRESGA
eukprot:390954_1